MAFFELLSRSAGTRLIAPYLGARPIGNSSGSGGGHWNKLRDMFIVLLKLWCLEKIPFPILILVVRAHVIIPRLARQEDEVL
nr:hypothetical protein [Prosthecochloris sp. HL-130-GSB]